MKMALKDYWFEISMVLIMLAFVGILYFGAVKPNEGYYEHCKKAVNQTIIGNLSSGPVDSELLNDTTLENDTNIQFYNITFKNGNSTIISVVGRCLTYEKVRDGRPSSS